MSENFDKTISPYDIQDFQQEAVDKDIDRRRTVYERLHSPELTEKLNIDRAKQYVVERTGEKITCGVYVIDVEHRDEAIEQVGGIAYEDAHALYNADTHSAVLFVFPEVPTVANEALLVHELAHSVGQRVMFVNNKDRQNINYGTKRIGLKLSIGYGDFLEEAFVSNIQISYAAEYADEEYFEALSQRLEREISSSRDLENLGSVEIKAKDGKDKVSIWPRYMFPKQSGTVVEDNVLLAYAYDQISAKLVRHGYYNLDKLINNARKSPESIKKLATAINESLGKGAYIRLQKTPYTRNINELIQTISWIKDSES